MNKLVFPCYYTSMLVRRAIKHVIWFWPNDYDYNYLFLIARTYHKLFTKKVTVNDLSKFICLLLVKQQCWKNFQDNYCANLHPNCSMKKWQIRKKSETVVYNVWWKGEHIVTKYLRRSCIIMIGDIAIRYVL